MQVACQAAEQEQATLRQRVTELEKRSGDTVQLQTELTELHSHRASLQTQLAAKEDACAAQKDQIAALVQCVTTCCQTKPAQLTAYAGNARVCDSTI